MHWWDLSWHVEMEINAAAKYGYFEVSQVRIDLQIQDLR